MYDDNPADTIVFAMPLSHCFLCVLVVKGFQSRHFWLGCIKGWQHGKHVLFELGKYGQEAVDAIVFVITLSHCFLCLLLSIHMPSTKTLGIGMCQVFLP